MAEFIECIAKSSHFLSESFLELSTKQDYSVIFYTMKQLLSIF